MIVFPPCKINLGLYITGKRADGYHALQTVMYQLPFYDVLEIIPADHLSFTSSGLSIAGPEENNLCLRAYHLLKADFDLAPVQIYLHKRIPMGAGLGGGSADGTYTLMALNQLFDLKLTDDQLRQYALNLGSDCPLFVDSRPQLAQGRGEILKPLDFSLEGYYLQLMNIGIHVSTREAFELVPHSASVPDLEKWMFQKPDHWRDHVQNSFEKPIFERYPALADLARDRYDAGALYVSMTGSGSSVFALFDKKPPPFVQFTGKFDVNLITLL